MTEPTFSDDIRDFCAHVLHLCDYVTQANTLTDIQTVKDKARAVEREAFAMSKVVMK